MTGTAAVQEDWTHGRASELAQRAARGQNILNPMDEMPDMPGMGNSVSALAPAPIYRSTD